jgi:UDP-GlcNAc:undecaprenyl-phosphate GlcNAc-1-phosphate transferase
MISHELILLASGALGLSLSVTMVVEWVAHRLLIFDQPGERKIHSRPVPRLGGIAFFLVPVVFYLFGYFELPLGFILGALCVYVGGFYDDLRPANSALIKLMTQIPAALIFAAALELHFLDLPTWGLWALRFVIASYVLFMVNAANLMDNMNGLTGGLAIFWLGGLFLMVVAAQSYALFPRRGAVLVIFIFSILGFYLRNFPWGKIYMGDQGSQLIGFSLAGLSLLFLPSLFQSKTSMTILGTSWILLLLSLVFIVDVATVSVIRIREKRPLWKGDQRHLSHQLVGRGLSQTGAAFVLYGAQFFLVVLAVGSWIYLDRVLSF